MGLHGLFPVTLYVCEGYWLRDGVAEDYDGGAKEGIVGRRGSVGERELVRAIVEADVEGEWLVKITQCGQLLGWSVVVGGAEGQAAGSASDDMSRIAHRRVRRWCDVR